MTTFEIPRAATPEVSIVVVSWNTSLWVQRCLQAIAWNTPPVHEVIVVDNGSSDDTLEVLDRHVSGVDVVANERNAGFGPACNQGALQARAPYLCFLNPDAIVLPGWLDPLLEVLDADGSVGAVVPRLFNWDDDRFDDGFAGSLQEAGCIVGRGGTTQSVGYGDDPERPYYRFPRVIDYGSAACMLVRRSAFEAVGGFDPVFHPAYCEDVDLCFALRDHGFVTRFEPRSRVVHVRGVTADDSTRSELLERHTALLRERWSGVLDGRPSIIELPAYPHRALAARDATCAARVLLAAGRVPAPGTPLRRVVEALTSAWPDARVTLLADDGESTDVEALLALGAEVVSGPRDWADLLERRWFHYDVVVDGGGASGELRAQVARTQPQAEVVDLPEVADTLRPLTRHGVLAG